VNHLLAVDMGLRTGLALYGRDGRLIWYRSQNFGSAPRLRRAVPGILRDIPALTCLVVEGSGPLAEIWKKEAQRFGIRTLQLGAEAWRKVFLLPREQRTGAEAKRHADEAARQVIAWSGAPRPTSLRHDAAEAVLVGLWGVLKLGWLEEPPDALRSGRGQINL